MYSSLGPKKYAKKFDKHPVKELQFTLAFSNAIHGVNERNKEHAQLHSHPRL